MNAGPITKLDTFLIGLQIGRLRTVAASTVRDVKNVVFQSGHISYFCTPKNRQNLPKNRGL